MSALTHSTGRLPRAGECDMLSSEFREIANRYIDNQISLNELEEWLVPNLPDYLVSPQSDDADIASVIELGLADVSLGNRTQDEFRNDLKIALYEHTEAILWPMSKSVETGVVNQFQLRNAVFGLQRSVTTVVIRELV
jgi:hypothetical protein